MRYAPVLQGTATTREAVRPAIQHDQESPRERYGVDPTTAAKRRKRAAVADLPHRSKEPKSLGCDQPFCWDFRPSLVRRTAVARSAGYAAPAFEPGGEEGVEPRRDPS